MRRSERMMMMDEFKMKNQLTPYPTERMVMFDQYEAGYSAGYSAGRRKILNKLDYLIKTYSDSIDLAYEVNYLLVTETKGET